MQVPRTVVQVQAGPAGKGVKIDMLNPSAACSALEPRPPLLVPRYQNGIPVDQNIRRASGELVSIFAPLEPCRRSFHERTDEIELVRVEACPVLDEAIEREVGRMRIAEQTEGAGHRSENNTGHLGDARPDQWSRLWWPYGLSYGPSMVEHELHHAASA